MIILQLWLTLLCPCLVVPGKDFGVSPQPAMVMCVGMGSGDCGSLRAGQTTARNGDTLFDSSGDAFFRFFLLYRTLTDICELPESEGEGEVEVEEAREATWRCSAVRWLKCASGWLRRGNGGWTRTVTDEHRRTRTGEGERFMKSLYEYIARRSNHEEGVIERFWEGCVVVCYPPVAGLRGFAFVFPRVARGAQPWALLRNTVGVGALSVG